MHERRGLGRGFFVGVGPETKFSLSAAEERRTGIGRRTLWGGQGGDWASGISQFTEYRGFKVEGENKNNVSIFIQIYNV